MATHFDSEFTRKNYAVNREFIPTAEVNQAVSWIVRESACQHGVINDQGRAKESNPTTTGCSRHKLEQGAHHDETEQQIVGGENG